MAFPIDPGRPPGIQPLENLVPDQGNVDPRAMLPLAPAREQQHHDVRQHAGLGHAQHDEDMNLEDMLPLRQAFNLDQDDAMLEDDNNQLREQRAGRAFLQGNKAGHALMAPSATLVSEVPDATVSHQ